MELALAEDHVKDLKLATSLKDIMTRVETQHKVNESGTSYHGSPRGRH